MNESTINDINNQYINCPECGIRNFTDDKICGVCKTKLNATTSKTNTKPPTQPINNKIFFLIIGGLLFIYYIFIKESGTKENLSNETNNVNNLENSPETQLAVINDQTKSPKQLTINLFSGLLTSLTNKYSHRTKQEIGNALVAAYNIISKNGQSDSLLEFTTAFDAYSKNMNTKFNFSIEEALTLFIKVSYPI